MRHPNLHLECRLDSEDESVVPLKRIYSGANVSKEMRSVFDKHEKIPWYVVLTMERVDAHSKRHLQVERRLGRDECRA
jgi:hypothetical protein